jgi:hypothetical protein
MPSTPSWTTEQIETAFVIEFSTQGTKLASALLSVSDRRERVRIAILREGREKLAFRDTGMTYAEAYRRLYGEAIDKRKFPRDVIPAHHEEALDDPDESDEDWS